MPATSALRRRSRENTATCTQNAQARRDRGAPAAPRQDTCARLLQRLLVRIDHVARLVLFWPHDDALARLVELRDVAGLDTLKLHLEHPGRGPLAVRAELHLADDRVVLPRVEVLDNLLLIQALGALDGLAEHLEIGVGPRGQVV